MSEASGEITLNARQGRTPSGSFVQIGGQDFYRIQDYQSLPPFLMSIVSAGEQWMFVSSSGGLTAGRASAEQCLFPYQTVDKLHDCAAHTGPITFIRPSKTLASSAIWHPFADGLVGASAGLRSLIKHVVGNELIFEEVHPSLELTFRYSWRTASRFGFIRTATLENTGLEDIEVDVIDGLQNILPSGVPLPANQNASCLVDAYKHNEYDPATGLAIYSLTSQIVDRAEAAEVLTASTVWCRGLDAKTVALSSRGIQALLAGTMSDSETLCAGQRGNFLVSSTISLAPGEAHSWYIVADVARSHQQVAEIRQQLLHDSDLNSMLEESIQRDHEELLRNVASADGLQATGCQLASVHHFANVLFNNMRGGVFAANYSIEKRDFLEFVAARNRVVYAAEKTLLGTLPDQIEYAALLELTRKRGNPDLQRLALEYLPITFSRRHGDPSRPWNQFEIHVRNADGTRTYNYQGNWRDIFQNWEALCASFPLFLTSIVAKFVNASTIDGFNPYRLTRDGIDWEIPDPDDPWSNIGYWGDHQIAYLTKLLEALHKYVPGEVERLLEEPIFCYANVPYRINPFDNLVADSGQTIVYDKFTADQIDRHVERIGADGRSRLDAQGNVGHVNLIEKLLVPALSKLSNFALDGGIWLNTQRPEWNDANNALVGSGLSMVTVCYLRRYLTLLVEILKETSNRRLAVSVEVEQWFRGIRTVLKQNRSLLHESSIPDSDRRCILEAVGRIFSDYRLKVYEDGFSGKHTIGSTELIEFFQLAIEYIDHAIRANRRTDCLYHAYNLLDLHEDDQSASVSHLYEMLEGQVAALSSGLLDPGQAVELIHALFDSQLYRHDQRSFMLYPDRSLPGFLQRNHIAADRVESILLLRRLIEAGDETVIVRDVLGEYHFHHAIQTQSDLEERLQQLAHENGWTDVVANDQQHVLDIFEEVFHHKTYTGRSGTMYGYEGLGCIYWHMVSKLLLAVQENVFRAADRQASRAVIEALADAYFLVRGGLSSSKTPSEYGAFPTDPYSHTPKHNGAQQSGMTGQVKEEVLTRQGELGIRIRDGRLSFQPLLLRRREFLDTNTTFTYYDVGGQEQTLEIAPRSLAFTLCQVPIVYRLTDAPCTIEVSFVDGRSKSIQQDSLDAQISQSLFERRGEIARIDVYLADAEICRA